MYFDNVTLTNMTIHLRLDSRIEQSFQLSEEQDEMPHNAEFLQGLHCVLRQNRSSEKEIQ